MCHLHVNATTTRTQYSEFIDAIRQRVSGPLLYDRIAATTTARGATFVVRLTTDTHEVRVLLRTLDLYVQGWWTRSTTRTKGKKHIPITNTYYRMEGTTDTYLPDEPGLADVFDLGFGVGYDALEGRATGSGSQAQPVNRGEIALGRNALMFAINALGNAEDNPYVTDVPRALLIVIQMLSEAARFDAIRDRLTPDVAWQGGVQLGQAFAENIEGTWEGNAAYFRARLQDPQVPAVTTRTGIRLYALSAFVGFLAIAKGKDELRRSAPNPPGNQAPPGGPDGVANLSPLVGAVMEEEAEVHFFCCDSCAAVDLSLTRGRGDLLINVVSTSEEWTALRECRFSSWIDAVLPYPGSRNRAYFFSGDQYALIEFSTEPTQSKVVSGPRSIAEGWRSLRQLGFSTGVDAVLPASTEGSGAYFFRGDQYVWAEKLEGAAEDTQIHAPASVAEDWPSLRVASMLTAYQGTTADFVRRLNGAVADPADPRYAYFFSGDQYVRAAVKSTTGPDLIADGPAPIRDNWPALVQAGYF
ncbi:ribosome-inactivating family protein [Streptomyces sp. NPDC001728]|uniref:ribosome-inactivating family protein n=1 Tax=Streptomyces sp. NPDC001728 TaxID=3154396 RepID=UPI00332FE071